MAKHAGPLALMLLAISGAPAFAIDQASTTLADF